MKLMKLLAIIRLLILIAAFAGGIVNSSVAGAAKESKDAGVSAKAQAKETSEAEDDDDEEDDEDEDEEDDDDN